MVQPSNNSALAVACVLVLAAPAAFSGEWTTSASVAPKLVYTDNVCLSADDEEGELYGVVTPHGSIRGKGNRANVSLSTSVDVNSLTNGSLEDKGCGGGDRDREQYTPNLNARADAVLVEQLLYIDSDATISQNETSPFVAGGDDSADRTGNTNTTYRYSVSPYVARRFKDVANLLLRYTYDDQYNSKDVVGDSSKQSVQFLLSGGPVFSPVTGSLQGDYSKIDYSDSSGRGSANNDSELKSAQFNLGYQINRAWQINGFYGNEWNDFVSSRDDIDGDYWGAGLRWTPNVRTSVDVGTGDRFFGTTPWLTISHRHKRSLFSAHYAKTLTYSRDIRTLDAGDDFEQPGTSTSLSNSPILDERFTLAYSYNGRISTLRIDGSYSDQTREGDADRNDPALLDLEESTYKRVSMSLSRPLSRKLSLTGRVSWHEQEPKGDHSEIITKSETWRFSLGAQRPLNSNINLSLKYVYTDRQSDNAFDEYQENRISLTVSFDLI